MQALGVGRGILWRVGGRAPGRAQGYEHERGHAGRVWPYVGWGAWLVATWHPRAHWSPTTVEVGTQGTGVAVGACSGACRGVWGD